MDLLTWSSTLIALLFCLGYLCIIYEEQMGIHKTASALGMASVCWLICFITPRFAAEEVFSHAIGKASEVFSFLVGALAIVEVMDAHHSFSMLTRYIKARSPLVLLWVIGTITFFLSAILDNLTTTVVMVTLLQQLFPKGETRLLLGGAVVIAANAGGAWTPIGDVTTTMLWIGGQLTATGVIHALLTPSLVCCLFAFTLLSYQLKRIQLTDPTLKKPYVHHASPTQHSTLFFVLGISILLFIPIIKTLSGLSPVMCMLLGVSCIWVVNDRIHRHDTQETFRMPTLLKGIDLPSVLFFLGILLAVESLEVSGVLSGIAYEMDHLFPNKQAISFAMGILSAIIDNVPLVAAMMKMYTLETDPTFWHSIAYTAGTGGSILIIGSAAGVAFMGMEGAHFGWWLRRITPAAFLGYIAGFGSHLLLS